MAKILDLIYRVTDKATPGIKKIKQEQQGLSQSLKGAAPVVGALAGAYVALGKQVLNLSMSYMDSTIAIGDFATKIGSSVEEASALVEIAGDLDLDLGALEKAFKKMSDEGLDPSVEGLVEVRKRLEDAGTPAEKLALATKLMGKAGADLIPIFEQLTDEELRNYAEGMSEAQVRTKEEYEEMLRLRDALKKTEDSWETTKLLVGSTALKLFDATDRLERLNRVLDGSTPYWRAFLENLGLAQEELYFTQTAAWAARDAINDIPGSKTISINTVSSFSETYTGRSEAPYVDANGYIWTYVDHKPVNSGRRDSKWLAEHNVPRSGRAGGGEIGTGGDSYMVGERGPELFTPRAPGHVTPNTDLGALATSIDRMITTLPTILRDAVERTK